MLTSHRCPQRVPLNLTFRHFVQYVTGSDGSKYVMRIYNNGNNTKRVVFEHAILKVSNRPPRTSRLPEAEPVTLQALESVPTSFELPRYVPSKKDGKTHITLSTGTQACISQLIPGTLPKAAKPEVRAPSGPSSPTMCIGMKET